MSRGKRSLGKIMLDCCASAWKLDKLPKFLTLVTETLKVISKHRKMNTSYSFPV